MRDISEEPVPRHSGHHWRILVAEEDPILSDALARFLRGSGHSVECVADGRAAIRTLDSGDFDLLVLDLGLPIVTGTQVLKQIRTRTDHLPVLLISALDDAEDRVRNLGLAVDDCLPIPFGLDEFAARIDRLASPGAQSAPVRPPKCGPSTCDPADSTARLGGIDLGLSQRDGALLELLVRRAGTLVTFEEIACRLSEWSEGVGEARVADCVDRLRDCLLNCALRIVAVRGLGYCLVELERSGAAGSG